MSTRGKTAHRPDGVDLGQEELFTELGLCFRVLDMQRAQRWTYRLWRIGQNHIPLPWRVKTERVSICSMDKGSIWSMSTLTPMTVQFSLYKTSISTLTRITHLSIEILSVGNDPLARVQFTTPTPRYVDPLTSGSFCVCSLALQLDTSRISTWCHRACGEEC